MHRAAHDPLSRRTFVAGSASALGAALIGAETLAADTTAASIPDGAVILFQGDSITDAGRAKQRAEPNAADALGLGYPLLTGAELLRANPGKGLRIFNRGISGNRVPDLEKRWQEDALALKPDILSILIGVNDLWHKIAGRFKGTVEEYESGYAALLRQTREALPSVRLVVLEPFVLRPASGAVTDAWFPEFDQRRAAAARVARAARATWIPLHDIFQRLTREAPPEYWAADGVHPTAAGHAAIARAWLSAVKL